MTQLNSEPAKQCVYLHWKQTSRPSNVIIKLRWNADNRKINVKKKVLYRWPQIDQPITDHINFYQMLKQRKKNQSTARNKTINFVVFFFIIPIEMQHENHHIHKNANQHRFAKIPLCVCVCCQTNVDTWKTLTEPKIFLSIMVTQSTINKQQS